MCGGGGSSTSTRVDRAHKHSLPHHDQWRQHALRRRRRSRFLALGPARSIPARGGRLPLPLPRRQIMPKSRVPYFRCRSPGFEEASAHGGRPKRNPTPTHAPAAKATLGQPACALHSATKSWEIGGGGGGPMPHSPEHGIEALRSPAPHQDI